MGAIIQGAGLSELRWDAQRLVICLPRRVLGAMWDTLAARLTEVWRSRSFIAWTQPAMTVRGSGPDAPRWKVHPLDVLSGLLFLLKVPTSHELARLWTVIDWSAINALCAPLYNNAHGGPHAWAPAQMVALSTLMFLYGMAHETTLLCRVQENIVWCWFCGFGLFGPWPDQAANSSAVKMRLILGNRSGKHTQPVKEHGCTGWADRAANSSAVKMRLILEIRVLYAPT